MKSTDNNEHLAEILRQLDGRSQALHNLREMDCHTSIFCYWEFNAQGGISLDLDIMGRLYELGLPVTWDVYSDDADESDA